MASQKLCNKQCDIIYDIIAAIISLFDVITDLWILIQWYFEDRMSFFAASLCILILANFAYLLVFNIRYADCYRDNPILICCCSCCFLPFAPLLSFTFYFLHDWQPCKNGCLNCFDWDTYSNYHESNESKSRQWMENKMSKHIGFLMEALMEAFPQCILQMIAIMYYNELNIVAVISIIVSMLSIATKSLILSAASSINLKTMIFSWFYAVTDFFSIFFVLSFVFYTGDDIDDENIIIILKNIWVYKIYLFVIPTCFICSIPTFIWGTKRIHYQFFYGEDNYWSYICCGVFIIPLWALGMVIGVMMLEIFCYSYIAFFIYKLSHGRIPTNKSAEPWSKILNWIKQSNKNTDIVTRICCVNRQLLLMKDNDNSLYQYLEKKEHSTQYRDVAYSSIRKIYPFDLIWNRIKDWFKDTNIATKIFFGYYMFSRLITFLFPFLVLILIMIKYGENYIIDGMPLFQMIMLLTMFGMILIILILLFVIWRDEKIIFHILPLKARLYAGIDDYLLEMIIAYYERLIIKPEIRNVLCQSIFGNDIGLLMFEFMAFELEEEEHAKQLKTYANKYTQEIKSNIANTIQMAMFRVHVAYV